VRAVDHLVAVAMHGVAFEVVGAELLCELIRELLCADEDEHLRRVLGPGDMAAGGSGDDPWDHPRACTMDRLNYDGCV